jgi:isopenicillin N synthase-like dioxygenase
VSVLPCVETIVPKSLNSKMDKVFDYDSLASSKEEILTQLHDYGFVLVRGVPGATETVQNFRRMGMAFIGLTDEEKARCTPENFYAFGWSYGEEIFNGSRDSFKGSYYADLLGTGENVDESVDSNVWPDFSTDSFDPVEFKEAYLGVGRLVSDTGKHVLSTIGYPLPGYQIKMRMLHYGAVSAENDDASPYWCGLHKDHCYFTGLIPALYFKDGESAPKSEESGLHIRGVPVTIPEDCLAFQVGETLGLVSNGEVVATEHDVRKAFDCERLTFATFISPTDDYKIESDVTNDRYEPGMTFKEFGDASYAKYYAGSAK